MAISALPFCTKTARAAYHYPDGITENWMLLARCEEARDVDRSRRGRDRPLRTITDTVNKDWNVEIVKPRNSPATSPVTSVGSGRQRNLERVGYCAGSPAKAIDSRDEDLYRGTAVPHLQRSSRKRQMDNTLPGSQNLIGRQSGRLLCIQRFLPVHNYVELAAGG